MVDENDVQSGVMEKQEAHQKGLLHRAFSIFVFNDKKELLLQQRAFAKYHSSGLWTNTCCGHPRPGENISSAAHRRLFEEMGFDCHLDQKHKFIYKTHLDNSLTEHELDYIFRGTYNGDINVNEAEVAYFKWVNLDWLKDDVDNNGQLYTVWFKIILKEFMEHLA